MNFAFKDTFKKYFCRHDPHNNFFKFALGNCLAGGTAGSISLLVTHPFDLVRTRLATDNKNKLGTRKYNGAIDCVYKLFRKEGIKSFYSGIVVSVVGIFAYRAVYFGGYDSFKFLYGHNKLEKENFQKKVQKNPKFAYLYDFLIKWIIAQSVTVFAGVCFYPLDTVRRRIMLAKQDSSVKKDVIMYKNSKDCIRQIKAKEGVKGFYKGFGANVLKTMGSSIILVLYDELQRFFGLSPRNSVKE
jgi:solute carrier family 25 (adenine nucleotide translocator) protein 4/5/6/31